MAKILALDDGSFSNKAHVLSRKHKTFLIGVIVEDSLIVKVLLKDVFIDGLDATDKVCEMIRPLKIEFIMLPSIFCAGFNLFDVKFLYEHFRIPLLIVNSKKPNKLTIEIALMRHFNDWEQRLNIIRKLPNPTPLSLGGEKIFFTSLGISPKKAVKILKRLIVLGNRPEPLRIVRLIAQGLGELG